MKQLIISVGREFGSGGHEIAQRLAEHYNIHMYDRNIITKLEEKHNLEEGELQQYDEAAKRRFFSRTVRGMSSSPEHNVAQLQFDFIKKKAAEGESFVIVGRCSETILKGYEGLVSLFILGDEDAKKERVARLYNMSEKEALEFMNLKDSKRKKYHNGHCDVKWGDSRNYDLSINSSRLGVDGTIEILIKYIDARRK